MSTKELKIDCPRCGYENHLKVMTKVKPRIRIVACMACWHDFKFEVLPGNEVKVLKIDPSN